LAQSTSPSPKNAPEQNAPSQFDAQSRQQRDQTLSERLDRSDGVIRPPSNVDPKIGVAPPATGDKMPVVPPDPNVKPKQAHESAASEILRHGAVLHCRCRGRSPVTGATPPAPRARRDSVRHETAPARE